MMTIGRHSTDALEDSFRAIIASTSPFFILLEKLRSIH